MKYAISLFFVFSASAEPIHIYYEGESTRALIVKEIFMNTYQVPEELMQLKNVLDCKNKALKGKLDLCLKNNGDLLVVSVDRAFVSESLKIFRAP